MKGIGSGRYLLFELDGDRYAIEVERVEVVLETVPITRVPQAPPHLKGVINYRGTVIPVADLRLRFGRTLREAGLEPAAATSALDVATGSPEAEPSVAEGGESIIVLHLRYGGEDIVMGILADMVREVVDIAPAKIERAPGLGNRGDGGLIAGIGEKDGHFVVILDVDAAFEDSEAFAVGPGGGEDGARGSLRQTEAKP